jgi:hypothetical protein
MKTKVLLTGLMMVLPSAAAIAQPAPPAAAPRACLEFGEIYNWNVVDNRTLVVEDNLHRKFRVSLLGYCPNLNFKERVGFRSLGAMRLTCLSPGDSVIVNNLGAGFQRCPIKSIEAYTPAMQKAEEAAAAANKKP